MGIAASFGDGLTLGAALVCAWATTTALIPLLRKKGVMDVPNARSSHRTPTPCGGGIGILAGVAAGWAVARASGIAAPGAGFLLAGLLVACCGFLDDCLKNVPVWARLGAHTLAAAVVLAGSGPLRQLPLPAPLDVPLGLLGWLLSLLWMVGMVNIYNFLDGIDGYAGFQGVVAGLSIAFFDFGVGFSAAGLAIAGACLGFLIHNWHPAHVFMGDVGSTALGFLLAALPFQLEAPARAKAVFCVSMCLWFFVSDAAFTLLRRLLRGEKLWHAHRSHLYQLLVQAGVRHDWVVIKVGAMALCVAGLTVVAARTDSPVGLWAALLLAVAGFAVYFWWAQAQYQHLAGPSQSSACQQG